VTSGNAQGIRANDVSKQFGTVAALSPVDLAVARGEVVTVLGPSGCGKTTLLRMIAGLEPVSGGWIEIDGERPDSARQRKRFGLVPQSPALLPWRTVEANARLLQDINSAANPSPVPDVVELLDHVGLGDFRDAYPHELSGGMQQRVAIARALVMDPPLVLADEPTGNLDTVSSDEVFQLLRRIHAERGTSFIVVTHDARLGARCDRLVELVDGQIARDQPVQADGVT
jgi:ABC-type nitrate/sulfonate/bicarbonate transport system ATPase subunit